MKLLLKETMLLLLTNSTILSLLTPKFWRLLGFCLKKWFPFLQMIGLLLKLLKVKFISWENWRKNRLVLWQVFPVGKLVWEAGFHLKTILLILWSIVKILLAIMKISGLSSKKLLQKNISHKTVFKETWKKSLICLYQQRQSHQAPPLSIKISWIQINIILLVLINKVYLYIGNWVHRRRQII